MPKVLLTRPRAQSEETARALPDGWEAVIWPMMEIQPLGVSAETLAEADYLVLTSARAAEALAPHAPVAKPAWCVGAATAAAAEAMGCAPAISAKGDGAALLALLTAERPQGRGLHLRGDEVRIDIAAGLTEAGVAAGAATVYEARAAGEAPDWLSDALLDPEMAVAAFYSPRSSRIFAALLPAETRPALARMRAAAISPAAAAPLADLGFAEVVIAEKAEGAAMRAAICGAAN